MGYFIYSAEQARLSTVTSGAIGSYDSGSGPVRFTERNHTGKSNFKDAAIVGNFDEDKLPKINLVITNASLYERGIRSAVLASPHPRAIVPIEPMTPPQPPVVRKPEKSLRHGPITRYRGPT
jgi:hypothetical protein